MRLLLDGHLDRKLKRYFGEQHDIVSVQERAWGSKENGELIQAAQRELEALVTMDRGYHTNKTLSDGVLHPFASKGTLQVPLASLCRYQEIYCYLESHEGIRVRI